jgi:hypothetical protein
MTPYIDVQWKEPILRLWRYIRYLRHRSELRALRCAMLIPYVAILPIFGICAFWWATFVLVVAPPALWLEHLSQGSVFWGSIMLLPITIGSLAFLGYGIPWFSRWYWIAVTLMFGRDTHAKAKERSLIDALENANVRNLTELLPGRSKK